MWIAIQNAVGARQGVGGGPGPTPPPYTPPMDAYPADVAYSVRLVSSTYSGPCMEVYRVSDGATQDIGFDSNGRISATELAAFSGGSVLEVQTWYDQMPGANHAISTINATTGTLTRAIIYDGSSIITDGIEPALDFVTPPEFPTLRFTNLGVASGYESFQVTNADTTNSGTPLYATSTGYNFNHHQPISYPTGNVFDGFGSNVRPNMGAIGFPNMYMQHVYNTTAGPTKNVRINNTLVGTASAAANVGSLSHYISAMARTQVGDVPAGRYTGYIKELFIYKSIQTSGMRDALTSNINNFYQIGNFPDYTSGFLADYSDAAAAYSVRKLSNTAIKCMRVRRTVAPFDELDIGFTPAGDLDEAAIVAFGAGNPLVVSRWYDQSGGSVHATQVTPNQPTIFNGTSVVIDNGRPALDFDGINDWFEIPSTQWSDGEVGVAVVMNADYSTGASTYFMTDTTILRGAYGVGGSFIVHYPTTPNQTNASNPTNGQRLITWDVSSGNASLRYDGAVAATQAVTGSIDTASSAAEIGRRNNNSAYVDGTIQELVVWRTATNIPAIETNIGEYYGIDVLLLDTYTTANAGYSLRKLRTDYTGSAVRVRRDVTPFDEQDIGFDSTGGLDVAALNTFSAGDPLRVSIWYDQTTGGWDVSNATYIKQPLIHDGTSVVLLNGKPAVDYENAAGNRSLNSGFGVITATADPLWVFSVTAKNTGATASFPKLSGPPVPMGTSGTTDNLFSVWRGTQVYWGIPVAAGTQYLRTETATGTTMNGYIDGTLSKTNAIGASNFTTQVQLGGGGGSSHKLQEYIVFEDNMSSDRVNLENTIKSYYGIP